jgi:hypothetical protein
VPLTSDYRNPAIWSPTDEDAGFSEEWVQADGRFSLPPGVYRFYALSSFSEGEGCGQPQISFEASVIIRVE